MYERAKKARAQMLEGFLQENVSQEGIAQEGISQEEVLQEEEAQIGEESQIGEEELLFQGAIDLLALCEDGTARIIDYKYSRKGAEGLKKRYEKQLALYKNVVAKILKLDKEKISCSIVNLLRGFETKL